MSDRCVFCLSRPATLSGEHIWDDWISRALRKAFGKRTYLITEYDEHDNPIRSYPSASIDRKVPVVCETCNNEWMSDIVNEDAKPTLADAILYGREVTFLPRGLHSIARFLFLKSVVIDAVRMKQSDRFYSPNVTQPFMSSHALPPGLQMWIAGSAQGRYHGHAWSSYLNVKNTRLAGAQFYLFTYVVGFVVLQLTCPRWVKRSRRHENLPRITPDPKWDLVASEFWPTASIPILWPGRELLNDRGLNSFRRRVENLVFAT